MQESIKNLTYVKSITMDDKGVLTITPSSGNPITYDARKYIKYSIEIKNGNEIHVNGSKIGTVTVPDPKLSVVNNELLVNGKSQNPKIILPKASTSSISVIKDKDGKIISVILKDGKDEYTISTQSALSGLIFIPEFVNPIMGTVTGGFNYQIPVNIICAVDNAFAENPAYFPITGNIAAAYRINPTNADLSKVKWSLVARKFIVGVKSAAVKSAVDDITDMFTINRVAPYGTGAVAIDARLNGQLGLTTDFDINTGKYNIAITLNGKEFFVGGIKTSQSIINTDIKALYHHVSLCGSVKNEKGDDVEVYSEPAIITPVVYTTGLYNMAVYKKGDPSSYVSYTTDKQRALDSKTPADHEIIYDNSSKVNLKNITAALAKRLLSAGDLYTLDELNCKDYEYVITDIPYTDQNNGDPSHCIDIAEDGEVTVRGGVASIGARPVAHVTIMDKRTKAAIASGYVIFTIVRSLTPVTPTPSNESVEIPYNTLFVNRSATNNYGVRKIKIDELEWDKAIKLSGSSGMTRDEFKSVYVTGAAIRHFEADGNTPWDIKKGYLEKNETGADADTYAFNLCVTPYSKFGKNTMVVDIIPADNSYKPLAVTIEYNVIKPDIKSKLIVKPEYRYDETPYDKETTVKAPIIDMPSCCGNYYRGIFASRYYSHMMAVYYGVVFKNNAKELREIFGQDDKGDPCWVDNKVNGSKFSLTLAEDYPGATYAPSHKVLNMCTDVRKEYELFRKGTGYESDNLNRFFGEDLYSSRGKGERMGIFLYPDSMNHTYGPNEMSKIDIEKHYRESQFNLKEDFFNLHFGVEYVNGETDYINTTLAFVNPIHIEQVRPNILTDYHDGHYIDEEDFIKNYNVYFNGELIFASGVKTEKMAAVKDYFTRPNGGIDCSYYIPEKWRNNCEHTTYGIRWTNMGSRLPKAEVVASAICSASTNFGAHAVILDPVIVKPER